MLLSLLTVSFALAPVSFPAPAAHADAPLAPNAGRLGEGLSGSWTADFPAGPAGQLQEIRFGWNVDERGEVHGGFIAGIGNGLILGRHDAKEGRILARVYTEEGEGEFVADLNADPLAVRIEVAGMKVDLEGRRVADALADDLDLLVATAYERPMQVHRKGLPEYWEEQIVELVRGTMESERIVGVSAAFIVDGEVLDVRSFGWQDYHEKVPASHETMYRWASISKVVTGVLGTQLAVDGKLDLQRDVREYVPEFPQKQHVVNVEDLLSHQAGIVHYQHGPIRTAATYEEADPFQDRIKALDMFKESPLLFAPREQYSYSTHGFALAGAAIQRAAGVRFAELADQRIATPLGMESFQPDFQPIDIPNRTRGYVRIAGGYVIDSGDSNVAWKLAGGGFISTVEDLARFGAGLMGDELLDEKGKALMFAERKTQDGAGTGYGLGVGVGETRGAPRWSHSGGQRKTSTYMLLYPQLRLGVCLMSNTERSPMGGLATEILELMLGPR